MSKFCSKCDQVIKRSKDIKYIKCDYFCGRFFHQTCVAVSDDDFVTINEKRLFWKCDSCSNISFADFINNFNDLVSSVRDLKNDFSSFLNSHQSNSPPRKTAKNQASSCQRDPKNVNNFVPCKINEPLLNELVFNLPQTLPKPINNESTINLANNDNDNNENNHNLNPVQNVNSQKTARTKRMVDIIGTDSTSSLTSIPKTKWLHISRFSNKTTSEDIVKYISEKTNISSELFKCYMLIKKDTEVSDLSFVTFKLSVPVDSLTTILDASVWPQHVHVKDFFSLNRKEKTAVIPPPPPPVQQ